MTLEEKYITFLKNLSSINILFVSEPSEPTTLYYYKENAHRAIARSFLLLSYFYGAVLSFYGKKVVKISDTDVDDYISSHFNLLQRYYVRNYKNGIFLTLIKSYLECSNRLTELKNENLSNYYRYIKDFDHMFNYSNDMYDLSKTVQDILYDPNNKYSFFSNIVPLFSFEQIQSISINNFYAYLDSHSDTMIAKYNS